jgi:hypothetical protein
MADQGDSRGEEAGRLLAYADCDNAPLVATLTSAHEASGIVVRGTHAAAVIRALPDVYRRQPIVVDLGAWTTETATPRDPFHLPSADGLFPVTLDSLAAGIVRDGVDALLTPSRFVEAGDWRSLRAVLKGAAATARDDLVTHVACHAAMLSGHHRATFLRNLDEHAADRPLAFTFAGSVGAHDRVRGLRELLAMYPGSLLVGTDALAGCDAAARGGWAAIGVTGSLRRPTPPGKRGGGFANGYVPGLFLRALWESRSPTTYADWYANSPSPRCALCGGRELDGFTNDAADKQAVLVHNVHAWLQVLDEIRSRSSLDAQAWLDADRRRALEEHLVLRPEASALEADRLLRALCEVDDLLGRKTDATGRWL